MFAHLTRHQSALALAALLSLSTAFGAAAESAPTSGREVSPGITVTTASDPSPSESSRMGGESVLPFTYNHTGPENLAPTRHNKSLDHGMDD
jgi:hypothetical protein